MKVIGFWFVMFVTGKRGFKKMPRLKRRKYFNVCKDASDLQQRLIVVRNRISRKKFRRAYDSLSFENQSIINNKIIINKE